MLHGALTGARGFLGGDGVGEVAFEIDVLLFCFGGQREVCVARDAPVDLDEIGATGFDSSTERRASSGFFTTMEPGQIGGLPSTMALVR
jgi:hypothetical protein